MYITYDLIVDLLSSGLIIMTIKGFGQFCSKNKLVKVSVLVGIMLICIFEIYGTLKLDSGTNTNTNTLTHITHRHGFPSRNVPVYVVISHCTQDLSWIEEEISSLNVRKITIYSKCGYPVTGAPCHSSVQFLPNVGRNDHTSIHYILHELDDVTDGVVLFLKDTNHVHHLRTTSVGSQHASGINGKKSLQQMIEESFGPSQFSCQQYIASSVGLDNVALYEYLMEFNLLNYASTFRKVLNNKQKEPFAIYPTMESWVDALGLKLRQPVTPVCYGGVFASTVKRLKEIDRGTWERLEHSVSRGDCIIEGHFMERAWAGLLSLEPLPDKEMLSLRNDTLCLRKNMAGYRGHLVLNADTLKKQNINEPFARIERAIRTCPPKYNAQQVHNISVHVVVSHCSHSVEWINDALSSLNITKITIFSKCGRPVVGAPPLSEIRTLPNVGRHHHTYAHYISELDVADGVVVFLKDSNHMRAPEINVMATMTSMIKESSGPSQFSCRQYIQTDTGLENEAIYDYLVNLTYSQRRHPSEIFYTDTQQDEPFSIYSSMKSWVDELGLKLRQPVTPVCFGGAFAVSVARLMQIDRGIWKKLEHSLSRGDKFVEYYMERAWAGMLSLEDLSVLDSLVRRNKTLCFREFGRGYSGQIVTSRDLFRNQPHSIPGRQFKNGLRVCPLKPTDE